MSSDKCCICLEIFDTKPQFSLKECNHSFHTSCILEHFRRGKPECPLCRNNPYKKNETSINSRHRERMSELRERQAIASRVPEVKKLQLKFRKNKKDYIKRRKQFMKGCSKIHKDLKINSTRVKAVISQRKYISCCISNRKRNKKNKSFERHVSFWRFNT